MTMREEDHAQDDRCGMPRRDAGRLRRHPRVHGARGPAPHVRRDGAAHFDQAHPHPRREVRRLHGRRLRARLGQAGHLHGAGDRCAQPRGGPARSVPGALPCHRHDRRARPPDQVPQGLPGSRRHAGVRARHQVQRHHRRRLPHPRHAAPGLPRRHLRHAGPRAFAVSRQRGPDRPGRSGDGAAGRAPVRRRAAVPAGAGFRQRGRRTEGAAGGRPAGDRGRRRGARLGCRAGAGGAGRAPRHSRRHLAQRQGFDPGQSRPVGRHGIALCKSKNFPNSQRDNRVENTYWLRA